MRIDERTYGSLVEKCQENGWVMKDGYPWQDDPFLEEYPYEFSECADLEELRSTFAHGNWSIRQGFLYDDLAFVQQVDGGDEWWTLKRVGDKGDASDWVDFESWSFQPSANYRAGTLGDRFTNAIRSMQMATPDQCKKLVYTLPKDSPNWGFSKTVDMDFDHVPRACRSFSAQMGDYDLTVYERPSGSGFTAEIFDREGKCIITSEEGIESALDAAKSLQNAAAICMENDVHDPRRFRDMQPLEAKIADAKAASKAAPANERSREAETRQI